MIIWITFSADREPWDSRFVVLIAEDVNQFAIICVQSEKHEENLPGLRFFFCLLESFWGITECRQMEAFLGSKTMMTSLFSLCRHQVK